MLTMKEILIRIVILYILQLITILIAFGVQMYEYKKTLIKDLIPFFPLIKIIKLSIIELNLLYNELK